MKNTKHCLLNLWRKDTMNNTRKTAMNIINDVVILMGLEFLSFLWTVYPKGIINQIFSFQFVVNAYNVFDILFRIIFFILYGVETYILVSQRIYGGFYPFVKHC